MAIPTGNRDLRSPLSLDGNNGARRREKKVVQTSQGDQSHG